ncbi:S8 family serine peptidase [Erythrobacter sp.]|jgi:hypothetical protein|uniref:S8 family serine peptidase n=1 Tax=Erythrobacter sp. TaxID=1042 RepID=UPI002E9D450B|nr:S8 family serine peptidase [Erythrobacter sp.]
MEQQPVDRPQYHSDRILVTLRPEALRAAGTEAIEMARTLTGSSTAFASGVAEHTEAASAAFGVSVGDEGGEAVTAERSALSYLEEVGAIRRAEPVLAPSRPSISASESDLIGTHSAIATVEAFPESVQLPSQEVLAGNLILTVDPARVDEVYSGLSADKKHVADVERVPIRRLLSPLPQGARQPVQPWHLSRSGLLAARQKAGFDDAASVRVAVLDTGIDADHPMLQPAIARYSYAPPYPGVPSGRRDISSHGTHVSGTIAAHGADNDVDGVSRAELHIFKIFDDQVDRLSYFTDRSGAIFVSDEYWVDPIMYLRALSACADDNIEIVNLSIGGEAIGDSREQQLFARLVNQGQIVVAAMGNERDTGSPTSWPAAYSDVIAVGALNINDEVAAFSNGGDHITVSAPGTDIMATMPTYDGVEFWRGRENADGSITRDTPIPWDKYRGTMSGTSMATPIVSGAASLWVAKNGRGHSAFTAALENSSRKLAQMGGLNHTVDHGWGCLDIERLLT